MVGEELSFDFSPEVAYLIHTMHGLAGIISMNAWAASKECKKLCRKPQVETPPQPFTLRETRRGGMVKIYAQGREQVVR